MKYFLVDLPNPETREQILRIHLAKRALGLEAIDTGRVAASCEGFSGSELEQLVVATLYACHARQENVSTQGLLEEAARTPPLSVVMSEKIGRLRQWAENRTVPAN